MVEEIGMTKTPKDALAEVRKALQAVDSLWSIDALEFSEEMKIPSPVGLVWDKVKEALQILDSIEVVGDADVEVVGIISSGIDNSFPVYSVKMHDHTSIQIIKAIKDAGFLVLRGK